ncbi:hypothetical protein POM88_040486 [Heracleum sosnowskyi]|uniref:Replication factor A C-terminal domain-containing protein n=1 Tax=Heracleum sosnowskyi TaxID=360622 RepID=A0AAD8HCD5_9APIA|nr:hypothetical protein POM88_040486 [Heracleum sosnowskyi]
MSSDECPDETTQGRENLKGYNLILLDDNNSHVQAFIYADQWNSMAVNIDEGSIYVISNFYTKEATSSCRPVSSKILINFSPSTTVQKLTEDDFMIPLHKFEFEFDSSIKTKFGQRNIVRFRITDGRNSHKVSIWGDLAVKAENDYNKAVETPVIAIVTNTRLKTYKNSVQISSLPSSKLYLNMDSDSVVAMRYRLEEEGYTVSQQSTGTPQEPVVQKVQNVEEADWWYNSCSDCEGEVEKVEGKLTCTNCTNKTIVVPEKRYRIVILAEDSSEAYNFILMDRATRRLTGMTATKMQYEMLKSS